MKKYLYLILFMFAGNMIQAQELNAGFDLYSRYVWRGLDLGGKSPSLQPWGNVTFKNDKHSLVVGVWGAFTVAGTANDETDLSLNYTYKKTFNLLVTDYFFPGLNTGNKDDYFEWRPNQTGHLLEGTVSFLGTEKIPVSLLFAMNFYGNDARQSNGDLALSKYVELGYKRNIKGLDVNFFVGGSLDDPDEEAGETGFYLNQRPAITHIGLKFTKPLKITETFELPIQYSLSTNPDQQKIFFAVGISI